MRKNGFTIVELLIVIVVIAILAAITIVAFNGVQSSSRDAVKKQDVAAIVKALEAYYAEKGYYPNANTYTPGSTAINGSWSSTSDASWANLIATMSPTITTLPKPSGSNLTVPAISNGNSYDYFGLQGSYCGVPSGQGYLLVYRLEGPQVNTYEGTCGGTAAGPYAGASNYRRVKS